jgi:hypothetical protein
MDSTGKVPGHVANFHKRGNKPLGSITVVNFFTASKYQLLKEDPVPRTD